MKLQLQVVHTREEILFSFGAYEQISNSNKDATGLKALTEERFDMHGF